MHPAFTRTDHRPWPAPRRRWTWRQTWSDLLFAHWPVDPALLRPLIPAPLEIDEFDGSAWLGVVPFRMSGVVRRPLPALPWFSAFPELNVRTYVRYRGEPGVWFMSLDASNPVAVWAARRWFHLPYTLARMRVQKRREELTYWSKRRTGGAEFEAIYRPVGDAREAQPGCVDHWLTERYRLYAQSPTGALWRGDVHHIPWRLQRAEAEIRVNSMTAPWGIELAGSPTHLHYANRVDVVLWSLERLD